MGYLNSALLNMYSLFDEVLVSILLYKTKISIYHKNLVYLVFFLIFRIPEVVDAFLRLIDDTHNNGGAMQVSKEGIEYLFPSEIKGKLK